MYELKKIPEDFIVTEKLAYKFTDGPFVLVSMKKKNFNTEDAVRRVAQALKVQRKSVGYAGSKDKFAVTTQNISIRYKDAEKINGIILKDIELEVLGRGSHPVSLGDLQGNYFEITARNITDEKIVPIEKYPNYFDTQRFSTNNAEVGKAIIKKDWKTVAEYLLKDNQHSKSIEEHLIMHENDYLGALRLLPRKNIMLYVHAYQSKLWNIVAEKLVKSNTDAEYLSLPGFSTDFQNHEEKFYEELLLKENITLREFIVRELPEATCEGSKRKIYSQIQELDIFDPQDDELNEGKKKVIFKFFLEKGSYATMAIKYMIQPI